MLVEVALCCLSLAGFVVLTRYVTSCRRLTKICPAGYIETVKMMSSIGTPPRWLLAMRHKAGSPVFRLRLPTWHDFVVVCDADIARAILTQPRLEKSPLYKIGSTFYGADNIFTKMTYNDGWDWARKGCAHAFTTSRICAAATACEQSLNVLQKILERHAQQGTSIMIADLMVRFTVDAVAASLFEGYAMNTLSGDEDAEGNRFLKDVEVALEEYIARRALNPLRQFYFWDPAVHHARQATARLRGLTQRILDSHRENSKARESASLLSQLCQNQSYKSDVERGSDLFLFLFAAHDTTGHSLSWTLIELAKHPEQQEKLAADVAVRGENSPILQCVIKEGLRCHPVAALGPVRVTASDVVTASGEIIQAGSTCMIPFYVLFQEDWIEDATSFCPERWHDDASQKQLLEHRVLPFALGKRNCLGQRMAMATMTTVLARLVCRFRFSLVEEPVEDYLLTLRPANATLAVALRIAEG